MMELLSPAGGPEQLEAALRYGADAVYLGLESYGLRAKAGNFTREQYETALKKAHSMGKKIYVTLNVFAYDEDLEGMAEAARYLAETGADAAIVTDPGFIAIARREAPSLCLHLSTQANTLNSAAARFWQQSGISRVVLARELHWEQIQAIHRSNPALELEAFVHGAVCMSYSGRCLLSNYFAERDGNQGNCAQSCRWQYRLEEQRRPGKYVPIEQDERGTYILSAHDINMIRHLPLLERAGVMSCKIEGRMKQPYYVATITRAYRRALDFYEEHPGEELPDALFEETEKISHRAYDTGFFFGHPKEAGGAAGYMQSAENIGRVVEYLEGVARIKLNNRFYVGDLLEVLRPGAENLAFHVESIYVEKNEEYADTWGHPQDIVRVPVPEEVTPGDIVRGPNRNHQREATP